MPIKITLQVDRVFDYVDPVDKSPVARLITASGTKSIISLNSATVETRDQAADILQTIVESLRAKA